MRAFSCISRVPSRVLLAGLAASGMRSQDQDRKSRVEDAFKAWTAVDGETAVGNCFGNWGRLTPPSSRHSATEVKTFRKRAITLTWALFVSGVRTAIVSQWR